MPSADRPKDSGSTAGDEALRAHVACRRLHVTFYQATFYQALSVVMAPFCQSDSRMLPILMDHIDRMSSRETTERTLAVASVPA